MLNKVRERLLYVDDGDLRDQPSQIYHENSKVGRAFATFTRDETQTERMIADLLSSVQGNRGRYPYCPSVPLAERTEGNGISLRCALAARRSHRQVRDRPLSFEAFSSMLRGATEVTGKADVTRTVSVPARSYPSAGGLYPIQVYAVVRTVTGLESGCYYLDADSGHLHRLGDTPSGDSMVGTFLGDANAGVAPAIIVLTAVLNRSTIKYGERAYRYCQIEAGHLGQNILLTALAHDIGAYPVGGFVESDIEDMLGVDGVEEIAVHSILLSDTSTD